MSRRFINNLVSVTLSMVRFVFLKMLYSDRFSYAGVQRFSPQTQVYFQGKGEIHLGSRVRAHSGVKLKSIGNGKLVIGENTAINYRCIIVCMYSIFIGKGVEFGPNVMIYDHDHDFRHPGGLKAGKFKKEKIVIGNNVWIGANSIILRGTTIGDNSVVGAGTVVKGVFQKDSLIIQKGNYEIRKIIEE